MNRRGSTAHLLFASITPLLGVACASLTVAASTGPEAARRWVERVDEVLQRGGFEARFSVEINMPDGDRTLRTTVRGTTVQRDATHVLTEARVGVTGFDDGAGDEIAVRVVGDGEHFWIELGSRGEPGLQLTRLPAESTSSAVPMGPGTGFGAGPTGWDILRQVSRIAGELDLTLVEQTDDRVVLQAAEAGVSGLGDGTEEVRLVLDPVTAFPVELRIGTQQLPTLRIGFDEVRFPESLPDDRFDYTPPAGVEIVDLGRGVPGS